ncbi:hypothetical protein AAHA92_12015 [Salvia divinorum]|uniref:Uncharacterized protein n=1 Tax=Salvia divinorum TaxID=28513 RepID=A0ABD1HJA7_SALDI
MLFSYNCAEIELNVLHSTKTAKDLLQRHGRNGPCFLLSRRDFCNVSNEPAFLFTPRRLLEVIGLVPLSARHLLRSFLCVVVEGCSDDEV